MMMDDVPQVVASANADADASATTMDDPAKVDAAPITAAPDVAAIDLTPAAIVTPTDLDKKVHTPKHQKSPESKTASVVDDAAAIEAAKKKKDAHDLKKKQHEEIAAEQEEAMRMVFVGDDDFDGEAGCDLYDDA